ncbi:alpha/beta hydrolase [Tothia fuscella]|uniref:Alpha/beta hydrolase n=1 Tax=Tothia fuscella TaxID=1048955 RepID=A0A9P4TYQ8_9PEZI|nr:alpha/beta hydrolase [Tothia fuscella]
MLRPVLFVHSPNNSSRSTSSTTVADLDNQTFTLPDGRALGYSEYGTPTGHPLFFLHGYPSSRLEAKGIHNIALKRNLRIIAPERPGFGLSTFQPDFHILDWPKDVLSLADSLQSKKFAIVGGSGGGPFALACAKVLPQERMSAVGILAGAAPWKGEARKYVSWDRRCLYFVAVHFPMLLRVLTDGTIGLLRKFVQTEYAKRRIDAFIEQAPKIGADIESRPIAEQREDFLRIVFEAFAQGSRGMVHETQLLGGDWGIKFEDITYAKILVWHPVLDKNVPVEMVRYMVKRLPHATLREFEGRTHYDVAIHLEEMMDELVGVVEK